MFKLLVVDDNLYDRECIVKLVDWKSLDIEVCSDAANGVEGYEKAIRMKPDFILTDVAMPLMDGLEMTEKLMAELPDTRFIFMSCHDEFDFAKVAIDLDVSAYILKPVDLEELVQAVTKVKKLKTDEISNNMYQQEMRAQIRESLPLLQESLMRDLIHGRVDSNAGMKERMNYLEVPFKSSYMILLMQIDNYFLEFGDASIDEKYLLIYSMKNIARESFLTDSQGYLLIQDYSTLCIILMGGWNTQEEALEGVLKQCEHCREQVNKRLNINMTTGIGNLSSDLSQMPRIYQRAESAVKSKFYSKGNRIIPASEIADENEGPEFDFTAIMREIEAILEKSDTEELQLMVERYINNEIQYDEGYVRSLCYSILVALQLYLSSKNESFAGIFGNEYAVWNKMTKFETILDIKLWIINILTTIKEHLAKKLNRRQTNIVQDIKDIIDKEFARIQSIQQISDRLYISSGYANSIFKQETGSTIGDYLFEKRIEAAKKLLQDPYCRIYEIAESIGYVSKSYFGAVFKEYTGMTPREYRDKFCR